MWFGFALFCGLVCAGFVSLLHCISCVAGWFTVWFVALGSWLLCCIDLRLMIAFCVYGGFVVLVCCMWFLVCVFGFGLCCVGCGGFLCFWLGCGWVDVDFVCVVVCFFPVCLVIVVLAWLIVLLLDDVNCCFLWF